MQYNPQLGQQLAQAQAQIHHQTQGQSQAQAQAFQLQLQLQSQAQAQAQAWASEQGQNQQPVPLSSLPVTQLGPGGQAYGWQGPQLGHGGYAGQVGQVNAPVPGHTVSNTYATQPPPSSVPYGPQPCHQFPQLQTGIPNGYQSGGHPNLAQYLPLVQQSSFNGHQGGGLPNQAQPLPFVQPARSYNYQQTNNHHPRLQAPNPHVPSLWTEDCTRNKMATAASEGLPGSEATNQQVEPVPAVSEPNADVSHSYPFFYVVTTRFACHERVCAAALEA